MLSFVEMILTKQTNEWHGCTHGYTHTHTRTRTYNAWLHAGWRAHSSAHGAHSQRSRSADPCGRVGRRERDRRPGECLRWGPPLTHAPRGVVFLSFSGECSASSVLDALPVTAVGLAGLAYCSVHFQQSMAATNVSVAAAHRLQGRAALHVATSSEPEDAVAINTLLQAGAKPNLTDKVQCSWVAGCVHAWVHACYDVMIVIYVWMLGG